MSRLGFVREVISAWLSAPHKATRGAGSENNGLLGSQKKTKSLSGGQSLTQLKG